MSKVKEIQARRTQVRQLSDIGKTTPEIALETGVTTRTVRLDLEAMGIQNDRRTSKLTSVFHSFSGINRFSPSNEITSTI